MSKFDYSLDYKNLNFRDRPDLYRVGKGEQGVLLVEPYKSEILPNWRFKNPDIATNSSQKIYQMFLEYLEQDDFVGADMARKIFCKWAIPDRDATLTTKAVKKYRSNPQKAGSQAAEKEARQEILPLDIDPIKAKSAEIFKAKWQEAKGNSKYQRLLEQHQQKYANNQAKNGTKTN